MKCDVDVDALRDCGFRGEALRRAKSASRKRAGREAREADVT